MTKHDPEDIQSEIEKRASRRTKRKKPSMKVSGRSVKELQRILINKKGAGTKGSSR